MFPPSPKNPVFGVAPVDRTSDSSDYALAPGETIFKTYSAATSVPLYIATVTPGLYKIRIIGSRAVATSTVGGVYLNPNNTTYASAILHTGRTRRGNSTDLNYDNYAESQFLLGVCRLETLECQLSTQTVSKTALVKSYCSRSDAVLTGEFDLGAVWDNTTTAWTSLGTLIFPYAQTGTIIIKRIL